MPLQEFAHWCMLQVAGWLFYCAVRVVLDGARRWHRTRTGTGTQPSVVRTLVVATTTTTPTPTVALRRCLGASLLLGACVLAVAFGVRWWVEFQHVYEEEASRSLTRKLNAVERYDLGCQPEPEPASELTFAFESEPDSDQEFEVRPDVDIDLANDAVTASTRSSGSSCTSLRARIHGQPPSVSHLSPQQMTCMELHHLATTDLQAYVRQETIHRFVAERTTDAPSLCGPGSICVHALEACIDRLATSTGWSFVATALAMMVVFNRAAYWYATIHAYRGCRTAVVASCTSVPLPTRFAPDDELWNQVVQEHRLATGLVGVG